MNEAPETLAWINYWKPKDDWYYMPRRRREELLQQWKAIRDSAIDQGGRQLGTYECRANTSWARVSLWEFPNLEVLTSMITKLEDAGYYQYFAENNAFGLRTDDPYGNYMVAADATADTAGDQQRLAND